MYLKCLIDDSINFRYSIEASTNDNVILYEIQEDESKEVKREIIFNGIIENVRTTNIDGIYYLEIEALTSSSLLDIQEKSRSFQDENMSYDDLINEILKDYAGFGFGQCMSMPMRIEKPLFQYKETDYEFLKRIVSQLGLELISDIINLTNMFYFGKPTGKSYIVNDDVNYNAVKDLDKYNKISALNGNLHDTDYFYYEVNLRESMKIGDSIKFKNIDFYINQYKAEYIKGELIYKYRFCRENGIWQEKIYNEKLNGMSLEGTVLETTGEILKLKLNIDEKQDINKAAWFVYAPPTGNILYSMPLVGDNVMLYFQNEYDRPVVTGCVRKNGSTFRRCANPDNRYYATESGNYLDMLPGAINFYRGGMNVCFNDESGISLSSNNNLNIGTQGGISMSAGNVSISGSNKLIVSKGKGGFISLEGELYNEATVVYENGSCRQPFFPFSDDIPDLGELLALRAEIQLNKFNPNGNAIASALAGSQAKYITQTSEKINTWTEEEIMKLQPYDPLNDYNENVEVRKKATNGQWFPGKVLDSEACGVDPFQAYNQDEFWKADKIQPHGEYKASSLRIPTSNYGPVNCDVGVGNIKGSYDFVMQLYDSDEKKVKPNLQLGLNGEVSGIDIDMNGKTDDKKIGGQADGSYDIGKGALGANINLGINKNDNIQLYASAEALVVAHEIEASQAISILGIKIKLTEKGYVGGAGAKAAIGVKDGKFEFEIGGCDIVGGGIKLTVE